MKKNKYLLLLFVLGLLFVSCEKQPQNEWNNFYGYTNEEIAGAYSFSNVMDAFDGLTESIYCHICEDAKITISADASSKIHFDMRSVKAGLNISLEGPTGLNSDDFLINFVDGEYELLAHVYSKASGQIRLHGFVRTTYPGLVNYYFDVVKN